jgi:hypothetical protein
MMLSTKAHPGETRARPIVFTLSAKDGSAAQVGEPEGLRLSDAAWETLAAHIADEPTLTPFPAEVLADRWRQGLAAVLKMDGEIGAYVSCAPVLDVATCARLLETWDSGVAPRVPGHTLPQVEVYESLSGWTHPSLRKLGLSLTLRRALLARVDTPSTLFVGFTAGTGASPVLTKLGWQVLPWRDISFVGSLIENSTVDCANGVLQGWRVDGLCPYDGPDQLTYGGAPEHDWSAHCHFWMSKPALARVLDGALARLNGRDLCLWRETWGRVVEGVLLGRGWVPIVLGE